MQLRRFHSQAIAEHEAAAREYHAKHPHSHHHLSVPYVFAPEHSTPHSGSKLEHCEPTGNASHHSHYGNTANNNAVTAMPPLTALPEDEREPTEEAVARKHAHELSVAALDLSVPLAPSGSGTSDTIAPSASSAVMSPSSGSTAPTPTPTPASATPTPQAVSARADVGSGHRLSHRMELPPLPPYHGPGHSHTDTTLPPNAIQSSLVGAAAAGTPASSVTGSPSPSNGPHGVDSAPTGMTSTSTASSNRAGQHPAQPGYAAPLASGSRRSSLSLGLHGSLRLLEGLFSHLALPTTHLARGPLKFDPWSGKRKHASPPASEPGYTPPNAEQVVAHASRPLSASPAVGHPTSGDAASAAPSAVSPVSVAAGVAAPASAPVSAVSAPASTPGAMSASTGTDPTGQITGHGHSTSSTRLLALNGSSPAPSPSPASGLPAMPSAGAAAANAGGASGGSVAASGDHQPQEHGLGLHPSHSLAALLQHLSGGLGHHHHTSSADAGSLTDKGHHHAPPPSNEELMSLALAQAKHARRERRRRHHEAALALLGLGSPAEAAWLAAVAAFGAAVLVVTTVSSIQAALTADPEPAACTI